MAKEKAIKRENLDYFEFQDIVNGTERYRIVVLNAKLADITPRIVKRDGRLMKVISALTTKDCRHIDGCVYFHLGNCHETVMNDLCQTFQNMMADRKAWKTTTETGKHLLKEKPVETKF